MKRGEAAFWAVAVAVVAILFCTAGLGGTEWGGTDPARLYYNLLVEGFQSGHLSLQAAVPPGLAALANPYDPRANAAYRFAPYFLQDISYFHGRFYLYFGITPALVLFWPWVALTGHYLAHKYAVAILGSAGFLVSAGLLRALWRRYFPEVSGWIAAAGAAALGLATSLTLLLERPGICEVPISCAYLFLMLALACVWNSLHRPGTRVRWLAAASLAYGFAIGARPSDLFGAAILLVPIWHYLRQSQPGVAGRETVRLGLAAVLPLTACGLGLLLYNDLRFGSPFDFGHAYQLSDIGPAPGFVLGSLIYNIRFYFLAPTFWVGSFPFAQGVRLPPLPRGYYPPDGVFGLLPNIPVAVLGLAAPLALRPRSAGEASPLRAFLAAVGILFGCILVPLLFYFAACGRYEAEFLPFLILLAVVGIFGLERVCSRRARWAVRAGWSALLAFSVGFNLLATFGRYAGDRYTDGEVLAQAGRFPEAEAKYRAALRVDPGFSQARLALAGLEMRTGQTEQALEQYRAETRLLPRSALAHYLLGNALDATGRSAEAVPEYEAAARLDPAEPMTYYGLGLALGRLRRFGEAEAAFQGALRLKPDYAEARGSLGDVYFMTGRVPQALAQYQAALQSAPDDSQLRARVQLAERALARPQ